jgi:ferritin
MISPRIVDAFNKQANAEVYSAYLYLAESDYFESINLKGFAKWMKVQAREELSHADRFYEHIIDRMGRAKVLAVEEPPFEWGSPAEAIKAAFDHEVKITGLINGLVSLAASEKDNTAFNFLQWFVAEQVEEEKQVDEILQKLKIAGGQGAGLLLIDSELGQRKTS